MSAWESLDLSLFYDPVFVDFEDEKGNAWCHKVFDPEETIRFVEAELPGVKGKLRERKKR